MKIIRYQTSEGPVSGVLQADGTARRLEGQPWPNPRVTDLVDEPAAWLAPVVPTQIIGIGLNYRFHAEETKARIPDHPIVFFKNIASITGPGGPIALPRHLRSDKVDYECELAVLVGRDMRNVPVESALDYVLGYTAANDVSARDWQKEWGGSQWSRAKSFDTFCPVGPVLVTADEIPNPNNLRLSTTVNGEVLQDWSTSDMIFDVATLLSFLSGSTTIPAGTLVLTGTPQGVGMARDPVRWLQPRDVVTVEVEGIGALTNPVIEEGT